MLRTATAVAATLATAAALAACGGSSSPTTTTSTASGASLRTPGGAGLKMAQCIRKHGVPDFPDPGNGRSQIQLNANANGGGTAVVNGVTLHVSAQKLQDAMQQCQKYAPQGPALSGAQLAKIKQSAIKMAECMRSHGVPNFPDPKVTTGPNGHGIGIEMGIASTAGGGQKLDPQSPAFQHAQQACGGLLGKLRVRAG